MQKRGKHIITSVYFICIFMVLFGFLFNTLSFRKTINNVSKNYMFDSNQQLASHISYRMRVGNEFIEDFAGTLGRMPDFLLTEDLLDRKLNNMELEGLAVLSREELLLSSGEIPELTQWLSEHPQVWDDTLVSYVKDSCIIFSSPILKDGKSDYILVAIQNYHDIQSLVSGIHYQRDCIHILFDNSKQQTIIMEKDSISSISDKEITQILNNLPNTNSRFETETHNAYISSEPVEGTNWFQISIIPSNIIIAETSRYIVAYLCLVIASFVLFTFTLYHFKELARKREQFFLHDSVTDGYNRDGFIIEGGRILEANDLSSYSVVFLNIRNFHYINEMWGEDSGNQTLRFIYRTLAKNISETELVCRSDMDHFIILLRENDEAAISDRIKDILSNINNVINIRYGVYNMDFSIGCCCLDVTNSLNHAINNATFAAKHAQEKNVCYFYNKETKKSIEEENQLNDLFDESIKNHDFKVYLQPKVSPLPDVPCQAEALVRWIHPERGVIFPDKFIPMLENNGKIGKLDLYMFEEVCRLVSDWIREGKTVTKISVNLSRYHLKDVGTDICNTYREIKERYNIPDNIIEIEITETMLMYHSQISFVKQVLKDFHECGLRVALDDFGFAYSSLSLLKDFEIDTLKLDRSFFINETEKSRIIVANIIKLAHSLDISVVAEGIEEEEQVAALTEYNCDMIQGYVFSRPLPVDDFEKWRDNIEK